MSRVDISQKKRANQPCLTEQIKNHCLKTLIMSVLNNNVLVLVSEAKLFVNSENKM